MMSAHFAGVEVYKVLEIVAALTLEDITARLQKSFDVNRCALSVVKASNEKATTAVAEREI
jgi:hypothetical protein